MAAMDPLIIASSRSGIRVRLVLRQTAGDSRPARFVEGLVLSVTDGRDGRPRLRMGIPTGSGDPVEVRVLLDSIERVEAVDSAPATPAIGSARPSTGAHRRSTIAFGSGSGPRQSDTAPVLRDSWDELPTETPRKAK